MESGVGLPGDLLDRPWDGGRMVIGGTKEGLLLQARNISSNPSRCYGAEANITKTNGCCLAAVKGRFTPVFLHAVVKAIDFSLMGPCP